MKIENKNNLGKLDFANLDNDSMKKLQDLEKDINLKNGTDDIVLIGLKK